MDEHGFGRALGAFLVPLIVGTVLATALWVTRKFFPRAEWWLFSPISRVIRRLAARARQGRPGLIRRD
jgi:hypothetical protein